MVVFIGCSSNNYSQTVLALFVKAVSQFGLPARIRCDRGVENYDTAMYMLTHPCRGPDMHPVIVGKSVHNQRIERLWRDLFQGVTSTYYYLFNHMEDIGILDPLDEKDLFSLHYVYMNIINNHLKEWVLAWNEHKMSSARNMSPMQQWIEGFAHMSEQLQCETLNNSWQHIVSKLCTHNYCIYYPLHFAQDSNYGIDWDGPLSTEPETEDEVSVPPIHCPLSNSSFTQLLQSIPNDHASVLHDNTYGIETYTRVRQFVNRV